MPDETETPPPKTRTTQPREILTIAVGVFFVALAVRGLHVVQINASPFASLLVGDARGYDAWAQRLVAGDWLGSEVFYQAPMYPYFLGAVYAVFGRDLAIARMCQAVIGSAACVLLAWAGCRFFSARVGLAAGLAMALYAPAIFFDGLFQKSVLDFFFLSLVLWLLSRQLDQPHASIWVWIGAAMGALILTRENALVLVPALLVWLWLHQRVSRKRRAVMTAAFGLGLAVLLLPVAVRNRIVGGEFHLTTSQFGPNFYIGNNENADGTYKPLKFGRGAPKVERQDATDLAERALGRKLTPAEVSRYWTGRALHFIKTQPAAYLRLTARKFRLLWSATEEIDTEDQYTYADFSIALRLTGYVLHFGVIAPLALFGLCVTWPQRRRLWLLYLLLGVYAASVVMFYVVARYRYPLAPILTLFAAAGLVAAPRFLRSASAARKLGFVAAAIAMALFSNRPTTSSGAMRATTFFNLGSELSSRGETVKAIQYYRDALKASPAFVEAHVNLGMALLEQDKVTEAVKHFREALRLKPADPKALFNLGTAAHKLNQIDEAIGYYRESLEYDPRDPDTHLNLAIALRQKRDLPAAIQHFLEAAHLDPTEPRARIGLGGVLRIGRKFDEAIAQYTEAVRIAPQDATAHYELGVTIAASGRLEQALTHLEDAVRCDPNHAMALTRVAWILATHTEERLRDAERAVELVERAAALTRQSHPLVLDTLAAAYAAVGKFDRAVNAAHAAIEAAERGGPRGFAERIRARLRLYQAGRPYRESGDP